MQYILLFLEGIITFISPCLLPMLPIYISYFSAGEANRKKALINSLGFVTGFTIVFTVLGAFAAAIGGVLKEYSTIVNIIMGLIVMFLGLNFMGVIKIGFLNRASQKRANTKKLGFVSSMVFGIVFSVGWTPCVGAFLSSALTMASMGQEIFQGIIMLIVFSLGLGIPFVISALIIDKLKGTFDFIKRNYRVINIVSGIFLVVMGILIATGVMGKFLTILTF